MKRRKLFGEEGDGGGRCLTPQTLEIFAGPASGSKLEAAEKFGGVYQAPERFVWEAFGGRCEALEASAKFLERPCEVRPFRGAL